MRKQLSEFTALACLLSVLKTMICADWDVYAADNFSLYLRRLSLRNLLVIFMVLSTVISAGEVKKKMKKDVYNMLSRSEKNVILKKGTELQFSGKYNDFLKKGLYICKQCNASLYTSENKFKSSCGWPSFDDEIKGAIKKTQDNDGKRIEILCANCDGHLGHVFTGEGLTEKNIRHCVNSISMNFIEADKADAKDIKNSKTVHENKKAYFAGGCFWGVEYHFEKEKGVVSAISGYMGGTKENPTYQEVCKKKTGHLETVEITYDPKKVNFETLAKLFFEIHDPTQVDGQGPDKGPQYLSAVFYNDETEKKTAQKLIDLLKVKGYKIATKLLKIGVFWKAEDFHQDYYEKNKKKPYCHSYRKRF